MFKSWDYKSGGLMLVVLALVWLALPGCDEMLPSAYQDETQKASDMDQRACDFFNADSGQAVVPVFFADAAVDSLWIQADQARVDSTYEVLSRQKVYRISNDGAQDTLYVLYRPEDGSEVDVRFYITFEINDQNSDAWIELDVLNKEGRKTGPVINDMAPEAMAACTQMVVIAGQDVYLPAIRAVYQTDLSGGVLLLRFILSDASGLDFFRIVILS